MDSRASDDVQDLVRVLRQVAASLDRIADRLAPGAAAESWLTPAQAAALLPVGDAQFIRVLLGRGELKGSKVGGRWLTTHEAVTDYVASRANAAPVRPRRRRAR